MKTPLSLSILALVTGLFASPHPMLAQEALPEGRSIEELAQEIEDLVAELDAKILSLDPMPDEILPDESLSDEPSLEGCRLEDRLEGDPLISRLDKLDRCITAFIEGSISALGGEEYIAAHADEFLETALTARMELFRQLNTFIGADGPFQQYVQRQKAEIDAFELEIQSLLDREIDATALLEAQQIRREKYQQLLIEMENTREQFMSLTSATGEFLQSWPRELDEILPELDALREKANAAIERAEALRNDLFGDPPKRDGENN